MFGETERDSCDGTGALYFFFLISTGEVVTSIKVRATNLRTSSRRMTGTEIFSTAHHSRTVRGHNEKTTERMST